MSPTLSSPDTLSPSLIGRKLLHKNFQKYADTPTPLSRPPHNGTRISRSSSESGTTTTTTTSKSTTTTTTPTPAIHERIENAYNLSRDFLSDILYPIVLQFIQDHGGYIIFTNTFLWVTLIIPMFCGWFWCGRWSVFAGFVWGFQLGYVGWWVREYLENTTDLKKLTVVVLSCAGAGFLGMLMGQPVKWCKCGG